MAFILHVHGVKDKKEKGRDYDFIDFSAWPLHIPNNVQSLFYQVSSPHGVQHQLVHLPRGRKEVFIEIKTAPNCGPVTMHILGLQQIGMGVQTYFKVVAETSVDVTGAPPADLHLIPSVGRKSVDSFFDLKNENGPEVHISHKHGSKYWIKTPRGDVTSCTQKIIILQQVQSMQTYFIFTERSWTFKSIPFWLHPGRDYRCIVYYSSASNYSNVLEVGALNEANDQGQSMPIEFRTHHLVQATQEKSASIYFTKEELNKMVLKAKSFLHRRKPRVSTIPYFYRNKSVEYYENIMHFCEGVMHPVLKDNNGDRYSILNNNMQGVFFSGLLLPSTLQPPKTSIFGTRRLYVKSTLLLNHNTNIYFADFYCYNNIVHYLTLVLTLPDSPADHFCQQNLVQLDKYNNPFLQLSSINGSQFVLVTLNLIVEIFYTEAVDLMGLSLTPGLSMYEDVPLAGRGSSVEGGIPKKDDCDICNIQV